MPGELAIVLSGGGAKGAFQVGVLEELVSRRGVRFDIFAGVSTGSIQAVGGAMNEIPGLIANWTGIRGNGDIYKKRPLGAAGALFGADSLYDAKKLKDRLNAYVDPARLKSARRKLIVGAVNIATGDYHDIEANGPDVADWIYASCAQPPYFQPLKRKNADGVTEKWVDGGVRDQTPLSGVMKLRPRAILAVLTQPALKPPGPPKSYDDLVEIGLRCVGIQTAEIFINDIDNAMLVNDFIGARESVRRRLLESGISGPAADVVLAPLDLQLAKYNFVPVMIIQPMDGYDPGETLEFKPAKIADNIAHGRAVVEQRWPAIKDFLGV